MCDLTKSELSGSTKTFFSYPNNPTDYSVS